MGNNILFVDDEENILKLMKRTFFNSNYNIFLASSAEDGLEIIRKNKIDIAVSDIRMAKIDGFLFLDMMKKISPDTYRVILSGFVDMDLVLKSIINGNAFDYITKPWDKEVLFRKIHEIIHLREGINNRDIISDLNKINSFPIKENNYIKIQEILNRNGSMEDIIAVAKKDLFLSSKIIKLINSAFYSENKIGSVTRAVNIMGIKGIKDIMNHSLIEKSEAFSPFQSKRFEIYNELISETNENFRLFYEIYFNKPLPEDLEMIGLAPFIGKIVFLYLYPEKYEDVYNYMLQNKNVSFVEAQLFFNNSDYNYKKLGSYLFGLWNFPNLYLNVIDNLVIPYNASIEIKEILAILAVSKEYSQKKIYKNKTDSLSYQKEHVIHRINDLIHNYNRTI